MSDAMEYLGDAGYTLNKDDSWNLPSPNHEPTPREIDAIVYLIEDCEFEGVRGLSAAAAERFLLT